MKTILFYILTVFSLSLALDASEKKSKLPEASGQYMFEAAELGEKSARKWLKLLDSGKYLKSWNKASHYFREVVKQNGWVKSMKEHREPYGKMASREVISRQYMTSLPGAPDGEYVVIQFNTKFEDGKTMVETVSPMRDKDGQWRVSGYFIKP